MNQSALILGANSDIGVAIAKKFAAHHYDIHLAARSTNAIETLANDLKIRYNIQATARLFDALDYDSHQAFYDACDPQPDVVICVFGYLGDQDKAQDDWPEAKKIIDTNYTGAVSFLNIAANAMEKTGAGSIVGISSVAGDRGRGSNYLYGSAKAGFTAYLSGLRNRLAKKGVHVLTVKPGFVKTQMTENLDLPPLLTAQPQQVGKDVWKAVKGKKNVLYTLWFWRYLMLIIKNIPESIFKKLNL